MNVHSRELSRYDHPVLVIDNIYVRFVLLCGWFWSRSSAIIAASKFLDGVVLTHWHVRFVGILTRCLVIELPLDINHERTGPKPEQVGLQPFVSKLLRSNTQRWFRNSQCNDCHGRGQE